MKDPPTGFAPHFRRSGLTDPWEPIFSKRVGGMIILGLWVGPAHLNAGGSVDGCLVAALADNAMGLSCAEHRGGGRGVTVSLAMDYLDVARPGQWVTFETNLVQMGPELSFALALVLADGAVWARANATFKLSEGRTRPAAAS